MAANVVASALARTAARSLQVVFQDNPLLLGDPRIIADTFADCIVAAVGRNRNLLDDPAVVKNFVQLDKALASHGWPSNWFDDFDDDDDDQGPKMPQKFRVLLERVCLSAGTTGKKRAARTQASI